jgi:hypothetical protein
MNKEKQQITTQNNNKPQQTTTLQQMPRGMNLHKCHASSNFLLPTENDGRFFGGSRPI